MKRFINDLKKYMYFCTYTAKADLRAEVANSYLNWIWWVLEPLCSMLVYYIVFSNIMPSTKEYYIIFIYSGLIMWNFFNKTIQYSVKVVRSNRDIVTKVYVPKFILLLSNMFLNGIKFLISFAILVVFMIGYRVPLTWNVIWVIPIYITFFVVCFGCGLIMLHFGVFIDDLGHAVTILLSMLFFMSGIFYDVQSGLESKALTFVLSNFCPTSSLIMSMRNCLIYSSAPNLVNIFLWLLIGVVFTVIGIRLIYKYENSYVKVV